MPGEGQSESHRNPKRKRGNTLRQVPRLRFGLRSTAV